MVAGGEQPVFAPSAEELEAEAVWRVQAGSFQLSTGTAEARSVAMAFCRLLGFMLTNGSPQLHSTGAHTQACAFLDHELDVRSFVSDVQLVAPGSMPTVRKLTNSWRVSLPHRLIRAMTALPGGSVGGRFDQLRALPAFLSQAPRCLVREFLAGLFGGSGQAPTLDKSSQLRRVRLAASTAQRGVSRLKELLRQVVELLAQFGVQATVSEPGKTAVSKTRGIVGDRQRVQLSALVSDQSVLAFAEHVGFRHCVHKAVRLAAAASWHRMQATVARQNDFLLATVRRLTGYRAVLAAARTRGLQGSAKEQYVQRHLKMPVAAALAEARQILAQRESVIDPGHVLDAAAIRGLLDCDVEHGEYEVTMPKAWLTQIGALSLFTSADEREVDTDAQREEENTDQQLDVCDEEAVSPRRKLHRVSGRGPLPTFALTVVGRRPVGCREVYDLTVPRFELFLAGGVAVHNCWFESGSMPYAQQHYPFENKEALDAGFPADFIAEGLDQTRGWFYTLMVISTALFNKPAFKNLIVNGLVLAADGKKMCWGAGTRLLMADGSARAVEEVREGDRLMGDDGCPRVVQAGSLVRGVDRMYSVRLNSRARDCWSCNDRHVLVLRIDQPPHCRHSQHQHSVLEWALKPGPEHGSGLPLLRTVSTHDTAAAAAEAAERLTSKWSAPVFECTVREFLSLPASTRDVLRMFQPDIALQFQQPAIDLQARLAAVCGRQLDSTTVRSVGWAVGVWLSTAEPSDGRISLLGLDHSDDPVVLALQAVYRALESPSDDSAAEAIVSVGEGETAAGRASCRVDMGDGFRSLLASYDLLKSQGFPLALLAESVAVRTAVYAGVVDGSGSLHAAERCHRVPCPSRHFVDGLIHLARGLGFAAATGGSEAVGWSVTISGGIERASGSLQLQHLRCPPPPTAAHNRHVNALSDCFSITPREVSRCLLRL